MFKNYVIEKKIFQNLVFFQPQVCNFIRKENLAQVFFCEFCEISKNTYFVVYFKKIALTVLRILSAQISQKHFFQFFYSRTWSFFHQCKTINLGVIFFQKKKKRFYTFLQMWLCHFHMIFRIYFFKNILRKT